METQDYNRTARDARLRHFEATLDKALMHKNPDQLYEDRAAAVTVASAIVRHIDERLDALADAIAARLQPRDAVHPRAEEQVEQTEQMKERDNDAIAILDALGVKDNPEAVKGFRIVLITDPISFEATSRIELLVTNRYARMPIKGNEAAHLKNLQGYLRRIGVDFKHLGENNNYRQ